MKVEIKIRVNNYGTDIQFDYFDGYWSLIFDDDFLIDYRSYNCEHNMAFDVNMSAIDYSPKNIRELTKVRKQYIKKTVKIRRNLLKDTNIPWFD